MANSAKRTTANGNRPMSLEGALAGASEVARSLRDTATQAESIEQAATRLASGGNEQAAAGEQIRASVESLAAGIEQTATSIQSLTRSQVHVGRDGQGAATGPGGDHDRFARGRLLGVRRTEGQRVARGFHRGHDRDPGGDVPIDQRRQRERRGSGGFERGAVGRRRGECAEHQGGLRARPEQRGVDGTDRHDRQRHGQGRGQDCSRSRADRRAHHRHDDRRRRRAGRDRTGREGWHRDGVRRRRDGRHRRGDVAIGAQCRRAGQGRRGCHNEHVHDADRSWPRPSRRWPRPPRRTRRSSRRMRLAPSN